MTQYIELIRIVAAIATPDEDARKLSDALSDLRVATRRGLTVEGGLFLLWAATRAFPPPPRGHDSRASNLVKALIQAPRAEYVPAVLEVFGQLDMSAQADALDLLSRVGNQDGATAFMSLLRQHGQGGVLPWKLRLYGLQRSPHNPEVYFPDLLSFAVDPNTDEVLLTCLYFAQSGLLASDSLLGFAPRLLEIYRVTEKEVTAREAENCSTWIWEDDYAPVRDRAGIILDLMGHIPDDAILTALERATQFSDPRLKMFAAISLLNHGKGVDTKILEAVAASAETRNRLFKTLRRMDRARLFPAKWNTQKAFAEGEMVEWLVFPTELGRVPDEIELMHVESLDTTTDDGILDWYLFRFRTFPPHWSAKDGWMAGVAGPFNRKEGLWTPTYVDTFSTFTPWDSKTPEEHVADLRELMQEARKGCPP